MERFNGTGGGIGRPANKKISLPSQMKTRTVPTGIPPTNPKQSSAAPYQIPTSFGGGGSAAPAEVADPFGPVEVSELLINDTDTLMINDTDKFIL